jgi:hypothetical protein
VGEATARRCSQHGRSHWGLQHTQQDSPKLGTRRVGTRLYQLGGVGDGSRPAVGRDHRRPTRGLRVVKPQRIHTAQRAVANSTRRQIPQRNIKGQQYLTTPNTLATPITITKPSPHINHHHHRHYHHWQKQTQQGWNNKQGTRDAWQSNHQDHTHHASVWYWNPVSHASSQTVKLVVTGLTPKTPPGTDRCFKHKAAQSNAIEEVNREPDASKVLAKTHLYAHA